MTASGFGFLAFLCATYLLWRYVARTEPWRQRLLLLASYIFYGTWALEFVGVLLFVTALQWQLGNRIHAAADPAVRKRWLALSIVSALGLLGYFKYAGFYIDDLRQLLGLLGATPATQSLASIIAPIGLSFYTFQSLSYTLDIHAGRLQPTTLRKFALFLGFFASVTSGPITKAGHLIPQFDGDGRAADTLPPAAVALIVRGLIKKIAFADVLSAHFVAPAFADPAHWSGAFLLVVVVAYSFQIYMDLSGYTDMARGTARCFGYDLAVNFNRPYLARSVSAFWQRWHMSMSGFFRDYLFFSLGGSRHGNVYLNLMVTFIAIGLWHGAGLNFLLYGVLHGSMVCIERVWRYRGGSDSRAAVAASAPLAVAAKILLTFSFVSLARVLFVTADFDSAVGFFTAMVAGTGSGGAAGPQGYVTLLAAILLHGVPAGAHLRAERWFFQKHAVAQGAALAAVIYSLIVLAAAPRPFVYFQF